MSNNQTPHNNEDRGHSQNKQSQGKPNPNRQPQGRPNPNRQSQSRPNPNRQPQGRPNPNRQARARQAQLKRAKERKIAILFTVIILVVLVGAIILTYAITHRHKHTPGPGPTCTEPQVCTTCGEVLKKALGHDKGPDATCTEPQVCERCGEVLQEALGHDAGDAAPCSSNLVCVRCNEPMAPTANHVVDETGKCTVCGEQIIPAGQNVIAAGANGAESDDSSSIVPETTAEGHYNTAAEGYSKNSVVICGDYGIEYFNPSSTSCDDWASVINTFAERYPDLNVTAMIVPKCSTYHFPPNYDDPHDNVASYIQNTYSLLDEGIVTPDVVTEFDAHKDEYLFYRTDHHWTSLGAYYASVAYCNANGITPFELDSYETSLRTGFIGTLYNYSGSNSNLKQNPDYTVFHYPHVAYSMVYYAYGSWNNASAFNSDTASYASAFILGDQTAEVFTTENSNNKTLLIFKESYGNAYSPYMIDYYSKVIVMDIRDTSLSISDIISAYGVTDVLFINNIQGAASLSSYISSRCMN